MMKILVISKEAWRDEQNGGNVLSNMFANFNADFAQIYCNEQEPNNGICKHYYQMTDRMMVNNILHRSKVGKILDYSCMPQNTNDQAESFKSATRNIGGSLKRALREMVWKMGKWDETEIQAFVREFNPDVIFAPCYGNNYMQKLTILVHEVANVPVISYISDDFYTNNQIKFSPLFWLNHFIVRHNTHKVFKHYSLVYTMTDEQKEQCERDFGANMKILRKSGVFDSQLEKQRVNGPIRFVYAGGIYLNRWKTLGHLADAMRSINEDDVKMTLDIYTNNPLTGEMSKAINDGTTSKVHKAVSMTKLREIYHHSDIALHAEAFDIANRHTVRMSFSTKIVDCLDSGCAVMAICDEKQAGFAYLKRNDSAICVSKIGDLKKVLQHLLDNPETIIDYQHKAFALGRKNHLQKDIDKMLEQDFYQYSKLR